MDQDDTLPEAPEAAAPQPFLALCDVPPEAAVPAFDPAAATARLAAGGRVLVLWQGLGPRIAAALAAGGGAAAATGDWQAGAAALMALVRADRGRVLAAELAPAALRRPRVAALLPEGAAGLVPAAAPPAETLLGHLLAIAALAASEALAALHDGLAAASLATAPPPGPQGEAAADLLARLRGAGAQAAAQAAAQETEAAFLRGLVRQLQQEAEALRSGHAAELRRLHAHVAVREDELARLRAQEAGLLARAEAQEARVRELLASTSWRVTGPLRALRRLAGRG